MRCSQARFLASVSASKIPLPDGTGSSDKSVGGSAGFDKSERQKNCFQLAALMAGSIRALEQPAPSAGASRVVRLRCRAVKRPSTAADEVRGEERRATGSCCLRALHFWRAAIAERRSPKTERSRQASDDLEGDCADKRARRSIRASGDTSFLGLRAGGTGQGAAGIPGRRRCHGMRASDGP